MILNDKQLTVSSAGSRKAIQWLAQELYWSELLKKLETPVRSTETLAEYLALSKSKQDDLKDVGGFVGGILENGRRKATAVLGRDVISLDFDNIPPGKTQDLINRVDGLGCCYAAYSTRKHSEAAPRLRILILLSRTVLPDEYEAISRKVASLIGIEMCDATTFEPSRLMYWPSCCSDSIYIFTFGDKPILNADGVLAMYGNWKDITEWAQVPGIENVHRRLVSKQGSPLEKKGVVGAFCKIYDIYKAIAEIIPSEYEACGQYNDRYTYLGGSTTGGAVIYDNGLFLFSHHATDPCSGKLVNAFDLVRLHKFSSLDDNAKADTPANKLPSYAAMCKFAIDDEQVATLLIKERHEKVLEDFSTPLQEISDDNWMGQLEVSSSTGLPAKTTKNVRIAIDNDPNLKGKICMDDFSEFIMAKGPFPWGDRENDFSFFRWGDPDDAGLRDYIQQIFGFRSKDIIDDALVLCSKKRKYNPVIDFLQTNKWDGKPRLDTLFIDYLGAEDCEFIRCVTRKAFTGAVARVMAPGVKFDYMTVIHGNQGIGKSTLLAKMGRNWFSDSLKTFEGKEAAELLQGVWIVEIGEMEAYSKTDVRTIKSFLSKCDDQYRAAYARKTEKHLRKCVFFGTTNDLDYLRDTTGNRRFWPVDAKAQKPSKSVFRDLDDVEISQIWAEAYTRWQLGEQLFLSPEMEKEAEHRREQHFDRDPIQGQIEEFLDKPIPDNWQKWDATQRQLFWGSQIKNEKEKCIQRDRVCAVEIWKECLGMFNTIPKAEAHRINGILERLPGWERVSTLRFGKIYGTQKGFRRV